MKNRAVRILHILPSLQLAGAESLVSNLLVRLDNTRFDIRLCVLYPSRDTQLDHQLSKIGIPVYYLGKRAGLDLRMVGRINVLLGTLKPDIVHTHGYLLRYPLAPTALSRIPVRIHTLHTLAHHEVNRVGRLPLWFAFRVFRFFPVSVSEAVAASVKKCYGVSSFVIYNGIPIETFYIARRRTKKRDSETLFVNVSGFRRAKNHRLLVEAFANVVRINKNVRLLLVGDGPLRPELESQVIARNLQSRVSFLGVRKNVAEVLRNCDIYVSSSDWEGFGLSIVEAMAAGLPIVATKVGAVPELMADQVNGFLVQKGDVKALAQAMLALAYDRTFRSRIETANRQRACARFNISTTVKAYEELYTELLEKRSKRLQSDM